MESIFPDGSVVKNPLANIRDAGDMGLNPGSGRSSGGGNENTLQYFCLENLIVRRAWQATVHRASKSWTQLSAHTYTYTHAHTHTHTHTEL